MYYFGAIKLVCNYSTVRKAFQEAVCDLWNMKMNVLKRWSELKPLILIDPER
jgi:hypothetical protein